MAQETTQQKEFLNKGVTLIKLLLWCQVKDLYLINIVKVLAKDLRNHIRKMNTTSRYYNKINKKMKTRD